MALYLIIFVCFLPYELHDGVVEAMETIVKPEKPGKLQVSGHIQFEGSAPENIPPGSWLTVTLQDTRLADAPAINLGKYEGEIKNYRKNDQLSYEIKDIHIPDDIDISSSDINTLSNVDGISLSALITCGEKRANIKKQDYLTMTMHILDLKENTYFYTNQDIAVEKYE